MRANFLLTNLWFFNRQIVRYLYDGQASVDLLALSSLRRISKLQNLNADERFDSGCGGDCTQAARGGFRSCRRTGHWPQRAQKEFSCTAARERRWQAHSAACSPRRG